MAGAATEAGASPFLILAPHASYRVAPFVGAAQRMGLAPMVASEGSGTLAAPGVEAVRIDFSDPAAAVQRLLALHALRPFAGVIGTDDVSTAVAALLAEHAGLVHNPLAAVRCARRKDLARRCLSEAGVRVPAFAVWDRRHGTIPTDLPFPVVIKPVALSASRGVIRADDIPALEQALRRLGAILNEVEAPEEAALVLIERFVPGIEVALEGLLREGALTVLAVFDKPDPLNGPHFEETYYITPSRLPARTLEALAREVQKACQAYGLREGPVHAECRINGQGVWILEVAARTIGGLCSRLLRFGTGCTLEEITIAHAVGRPLEQSLAPGAAGVLMIPIAEAGILSRVEGVLAASRVPYVEDVEISVRAGYELVPLPEGTSYLGFIFARAPTPAQAEQALRAAHAQLRVVVRPLWKPYAVS